MEPKLSLSELNDRIRETLENEFRSSVWITGEISELKENRNGHCYLELIEKQGGEIIARSRATIWSYTYRMLKPYFETTTGQIFTSGIKILVQVSVEFHSSFGLSLNIRDIDPVYTVGDMAIQRKEIIRRLQEEGVFVMNKELQLPLVPQKIAVISSATAAGYQDFMNQLEHNEHGFRFFSKLFEAVMQGAETVPSIINALDRIFQYEDFFDAVVVIRGGGSTADLSSFDSYELAYHVTQFPLPVITGIGHEKDDTIIDLVAHTRLKTPTAVAEFLIKGTETFFDRMMEIQNEIIQITRNTIQEKQAELEQIASTLKFSVNGFIVQNQNQLNKKGNQLQRGISQFSFHKEQKFSKLKHRIDTSVVLWFSDAGNRVQFLKSEIKHAVAGYITHKNSGIGMGKISLKSGIRNRLIFEKDRLHFNENTARLIDPGNVLKRGYTLTLKDGRIIKSAKLLEPGEQIETRFTDGKLTSKIITENNNEH